VIIVGGGPAGLATGIFLCHADPGRRGKVVVLEKERYPRDKFCAGGVGARADQVLARIGITVDVPSVPIDGMSLKLQGGTIIHREQAIGRVVRRLEYDHALARIAVERGVRVCEEAQVMALGVDGKGVAIESTAGPWRADVLVGADGVGSFVRRSMRLPVGRLRAQVLELDTEEVEGDPDRDMLHFDASDHALTGYAWDFPTVVDGRPFVCRGVYQLRRGEHEVDIHAVLRERLAARGLDIGRYRLKRYAERGFEIHAPFATRRVLLVGEAAGIDGLTGEGIAQAIGYGAFAGRYLAEKLAIRDFGFDDYAGRLARSKVGVELGVRARTIPYYFGRHRSRIERFVLSTPDFFALGLQHFAGRRLSRRRLAESAFSLARHLLARDRQRPPAVAETMTSVRAPP
jgi:menaquinone-9 beta-reductase